MQTMGSASRNRTLIASGFAVVLGGGVAASQFMAADAVAPLAPAATASASGAPSAPASPGVPTALSTAPSAQASVSPSPTPTPTPSLDPCRVDESSVKARWPTATQRSASDSHGPLTVWTVDGKDVARTRADAPGWSGDCVVR